MADSFPQFIPIMSSRTEQQTPSNLVIYVDPSPYPEVEGGYDPETVALLKSDYAGSHGELSAIAQYIFQNGRSAQDESFANSMLQIAIVEMMHLDMLGDAIVALGGNPSFDDGRYYWSASDVNYSVELADMLRDDIASETTAIDTYTRHIALTNNESVKALLERIIKDEQLHLRFFTELLASAQ